MFLEQCKRKGIKIEDLDTGWVPQHTLSEDSEEDEEYEDEEDEESELDEEDLFISRSRSREIRNSKRPHKSSSNDNVMFDIHDEEEKEEKEEKNVKVTVEKPEINLEDLEAMFGSSESTSDDNSSSSNIDSNHDRIRNELDKISPKTNSSTKIKLNIDKSSNTKQKIKLNIKQK